jgi:Ca2+-binding RTX toxin-like protein
VLDVTGVTASNLNLVGTGDLVSDEVVIDNLAQVATITDFEAVVLNEAALASGTSLTLDLDAGELKQGATTVNYDGTGLSVGGLMFEDADSYVDAATSGVTITVTDDGATGATVVGGDGDDTITGGAGADFITGGLGADVLDGNIVPAVQEVHTYTLSGSWAAGTADSSVTINGFTITEGDNVQGIVVSDGADADAIGAAFVREWDNNSASFTDGALIESITYDSVSNALTVTFLQTGADIADAELGAAVLVAGADANTFAVGAETVATPWAGQGEAVDTFVYNSAAESTAASMDQILNFSVGATDDIIDLSAVAAAAPLFHAGVQNGGSGFADYAAVEAAADVYLQTHGNSVFVGSDGTDTWVFADANHSIDLDAGDVVIQLTGIDATGIDATNFNFV